jgi:hypothetical protein
LLSRSHVALALLQFVGALVVSLFLLAVFGLDARAILLSNLAAGTLLLAAGAGAVLSGSATFSRRLRHVGPALGVLLVPVAFAGWAADHAEPLRSWPELRVVLACGLPYAMLLALQTAAVVPSFPPPTSECPPSPKVRARAFTYLVLAFVFLFLLVSLVARATLAPLEESFHSHAGLLIPFIAAAYALNGIQCALAPSLHLSERASLLPLLGGLAAAANLVLNLALIPWLGPLGAAAATLLTFLGLAGATYHMAQGAFPTPFEHGRLAKILSAAAIIYLATLRWPSTGSWAWFYAHVAMALIGFPVVLALAGFIQERERQALRRIFSVAPRRRSTASIA